MGRDEELRLLDAEATARPVVVAGEPGVGKSRLVATWSATRSRRAVTVIATRASATVPFGAFAPWVPGGLHPDRDRLDTLRAVTDRLLEPAPGAVVVDDAHLLDDASATLVLHLARRGSCPLVTTVRSGVPCPDPITAVWKDGIGTRIDLRALSERESTSLVERRLGGRLHAATEQRLWALSAGNPMYLREVTEAVLEQGRLTEADGVWSLSGPLAGTPRLIDLIEARIGRIDDADRAALEVVALGEPLSLDVLADVLSPEQVSRLAATGLLAVSARRGVEVVGLCHPLYGEVLRSTISPLVARGHHRALAAAVIARGEDGDDPLRVALWLHEGGGEEAPTDLLLAASARALVLQDYPLSERLAEAAAEAGGGVPALLARSRALGLQGDQEAAERVLTEASGLATSPGEVAEVAQALAIGRFWQGKGDGAWRTTIDEALDRLPPDWRHPVEVTGASLAAVNLEPGQARRLAARARHAEDRGTALNARTLEGWAGALEGQPSVLLAEFDALLPDILDRLAVDPLLAAFASTGYELAMVLEGRSADAEGLLGALVGDDGSTHIGEDRVFLALPILLLSHLALVQGRLRVAANRARQALELMGEDRPYVFARPAVAAGVAAAGAAQAGDGAGAADALARVQHRTDLWVPEARATLALGQAWSATARGEVGAGIATALESAQRLGQTGAHGLEVLALLDAARLGGGAQAAPRLVELAATVGGPVVQAAAGLACALAARDGGALDSASASMEAVGFLLAAAEAANQAADAHASRGLRRAEAVARRRTHELLRRCEGAATPLLAGADHPEVAAGLTAREREVALMAAAGRTNREVADALGVSLRTVNSHLNHAYAKLGTSDRDELARILAAPSLTADGAEPG